MKLFFLKRFYGLVLVFEGIFYFFTGTYPYIKKNSWESLGIWAAKLISKELYKKKG